MSGQRLSHTRLTFQELVIKEARFQKGLQETAIQSRYPEILVKWLCGFQRRLRP